MASKYDDDTTKSQQIIDDNDDDEFDDDEDIDALIEELTKFKGAKKPGRPKNPDPRTLMKVLLKVSSDLSGMTKQLKVNNSHLAGLVKRVETVERDVQSLASEADTDRKRILELEDRVDRMEQYNHRLTVVLTYNTASQRNESDEAAAPALDTPTQTPAETLTETPAAAEAPLGQRTERDVAHVRESLKSALALSDATMNGIRMRRASRTNKAKFLLHLDNPAIKGELFRKMKIQKPSGVYLNEFLTKHRESILYQLRRMKRDERKFHQVYSYHGDIFVKYTSNDTPKLIRSLSDI